MPERKKTPRGKPVKIEAGFDDTGILLDGVT